MPPVPVPKVLTKSQIYWLKHYEQIDRRLKTIAGISRTNSYGKSLSDADRLGGVDAIPVKYAVSGQEVGRDQLIEMINSWATWEVSEVHRTHGAAEGRATHEHGVEMDHSLPTIWIGLPRVSPVRYYQFLISGYLPVKD
jgi:hypothetical protein